MRYCLIVCLVLVGAAYGQDGMTGLLNPRLGELGAEFEYDSGVFCDRAVRGQDTDLGFAWYDLDAQLPLWQGDNFETAFFSSVGVMDIATRARLDDAGVDLPDHLWNVEFGSRGRWKLDNDWIAGLGVSVSSASDKPFDSFDETSLNLTGSLQIPSGERNSHFLFLSMSSNSGDLSYIPLPGYGYFWNIDRSRQLLLGVPFCWGRWELAERLTVMASYLIPRSVSAEVSYELVDGLAVYSGFDWRNQGWFRAGRDDDDNQIFYYEKKASIGLRWDLNDYIQIDLQGGYGFDRFFFEGENYGDRGDSQISLSDGFYVGAQLGVRF